MRVCAVCGGEEKDGCWSCEGSGVVNGKLPTVPGWYRAKVGDEIIPLEVDGELMVVGVGSGGRSIPVWNANWHARRDEPISEWGGPVALGTLRETPGG